MNRDLIIIIVSSFLALYMFHLIGKYVQRKKKSRQISRGIKLENQAARLLKDNGFKIIQHHYNLSYTILENNKPRKIELEADYIVEKNAKTYLVEVKSGEHTATVSYAPTRRQILEYYNATEFEGYILVNMHAKTITEISFPFKTSNSNKYIKVIAIFLIGIMIVGLHLHLTKYNSYIAIFIGCILILKCKSIYNWFIT